MKHITYLVLNIALFLSLMTLPGFANGQTQTTAPTQRLVVSFYSICCGIDQRAKENLDAFLKGYEKAKKKKLAKAEAHWGREGEIDYCMKLSEISRREQKKFISKVRLLLKSSKLVHINENAACQNAQ